MLLCSFLRSDYNGIFPELWHSLFILIHKSEYVSGFLPYGIIVCETDEVLCIRFYIFKLSAQNKKGKKMAKPFVQNNEIVDCN